MPIAKQCQSQQQHGPEHEFVWRDAEDDDDEDGPENGDGVDQRRPTAEVPWGGLGGDVFAGAAALVSPIEVHGNDVREVERDRAYGCDDVVGGGVQAD